MSRTESDRESIAKQKKNSKGPKLIILSLENKSEMNTIKMVSKGEFKMQDLEAVPEFSGIS